MVAQAQCFGALLLLQLLGWCIDQAAARGPFPTSIPERSPLCSSSTWRSSWNKATTTTTSGTFMAPSSHHSTTKPTSATLLAITPPRGGSSSSRPSTTLHSSEDPPKQPPINDKEVTDTTSSNAEDTVLLDKIASTQAVTPSGSTSPSDETITSSSNSSTSSIVPKENSATPPLTEHVQSLSSPRALSSRRDRFLALLNKALHRKKPEEISKKLKNRNTTNLSRKLLHASFGLTFAALNHFIPRRVFVTGMTVLSSGTLLMELLRYNPRFHFLNDILHGILGSSLRKHEMEGKFTGSFYFFLGVTVTAASFDRNCATLGIAQLALADPSASYFGRATRHVYWSRIENGLGGFGRNKGVLGFLGGALFCFPFNYQVLRLARYNKDNQLQLLPGGTTAIVAASLALGFAGAFADLAVPTPAVVLPKKVWGIPVPPLHVDDNFVVPIVSAWACEKVFAFLHWNTDAVRLATFMILKGPQQIQADKRSKKGDVGVYNGKKKEEMQ